MAKPHQIVSPALASEQRLLPPPEASAYLQQRWNIVRAVRTLAQMRYDGDGPKYRRNGNTVVYTPAAIDAWVLQAFETEVSSTTEESQRGSIERRTEAVPAT
jgi:hypothetical protein